MAAIAASLGSGANAQNAAQRQAMNEAALMEYADAHCPSLKVGRAGIEFDLKMSGVNVSRPAVAQFYAQYRARVFSALRARPIRSVCEEALKELGPYGFVRKANTPGPARAARPSNKGAASYPFEGWWAQETNRYDCGRARTIFTHTANKEEGEQESCHYKKVTRKDANTYIIDVACDDLQAESGSNQFAGRLKLTLSGSDTLAEETTLAKGQVIKMKRCPIPPASR
jgi:hypothetical protein